MGCRVTVCWVRWGCWVALCQWHAVMRGSAAARAASSMVPMLRSASSWSRLGPLELHAPLSSPLLPAAHRAQVHRPLKGAGLTPKHAGWPARPAQQCCHPCPLPSSTATLCTHCAGAPGAPGAAHLPGGTLAHLPCLHKH